jgi:hypothetical protein
MMHPDLWPWLAEEQTLQFLKGLKTYVSVLVTVVPRDPLFQAYLPNVMN